MSIRWMTLVWSSSEPFHPTDRLMLLALADTANDEGCCWPRIETLRSKCSLKTLRGARKVLARLEEGAFIERLERPGRSNVYQLLEERLDTPERQDRGAGPGTPERADRGGGTVGPGTPEQRDRVPRNGGTSRTNIEPSIEPSLNNNRGEEGVVDVSLSKLVGKLEERGVHGPVAKKLVRQFGADRVREQIEHYDYLCTRDETPPRPGWLVRAIEEGYVVPLSQHGCTKLYTYREMLAWCENRGNLRLTANFEPIKQDGTTFFRLKGNQDHE